LVFRVKEKNILRVFENRLLRIIFGPKKEEVMARRRKLHNEVLHNPSSSPNIIRVIRAGE
jgi:hypothetical protein